MGFELGQFVRVCFFIPRVCVFQSSSVVVDGMFQKMNARKQFNMKVLKRSIKEIFICLKLVEHVIYEFLVNFNDWK